MYNFKMPSNLVQRGQPLPEMPEGVGMPMPEMPSMQPDQAQGIQPRRHHPNRHGGENQNWRERGKNSVATPACGARTHRAFEQK